MPIVTSPAIWTQSQLVQKILTNNNAIKIVRYDNLSLYYVCSFNTSLDLIVKCLNQRILHLILWGAVYSCCS